MVSSALGRWLSAFASLRSRSSTCPSASPTFSNLSSLSLFALLVVSVLPARWFRFAPASLGFRSVCPLLLSLFRTVYALTLLILTVFGGLPLLRFFSPCFGSRCRQVSTYFATASPRSPCGSAWLGGWAFRVSLIGRASEVSALCGFHLSIFYQIGIYLSNIFCIIWKGFFRGYFGEGLGVLKNRDSQGFGGRKNSGSKQEAEGVKQYPVRKCPILCEFAQICPCFSF